MHKLLLTTLLGLVLSGCAIPSFGDDSAEAGFPPDRSEVEHLLPEIPEDYDFVLFEGRAPASGLAQVVEVTALRTGASPDRMIRLCIQAAGPGSDCPQGVSERSIELQALDERFADSRAVKRVRAFCADEGCDESDLLALQDAWTP